MADEEAITTTKALVTCEVCDGQGGSCAPCGGAGNYTVSLTRGYLTRWVSGYGLKAGSQRWISDLEDLE